MSGQVFPLGAFGFVFSASYNFGSSGDLKAIALAIIGTIGLVTYECLRKFKREPVRDWKDWLERNFVRLIFAGIISPQAIHAILDVLKMVR